MKKVKVDFRKNPWRGVITEVSVELGISVQTTSNRLRSNNKEVLELVLVKVHERHELLKRKDELMAA